MVNRHKVIEQLIDDVGQASMLIADWDDPELDEQRPQQQKVLGELIPEIHGCIDLLRMLSTQGLGLLSYFRLVYID